MRCKIIIKDEVNFKVEGLPVDMRRKLANKLKWQVPYARYMPQYKLGRWDGTVGFFGLGGNGYVNHLDVVLKTLMDNGYEVEDIEDNRQKHDLSFTKITKDYWQGKTWPKGHPAEGEPIVLRDYQVETINKFLESDIGKVNVVYNWFRNVAVQEARFENFLPIAFENKSNFSNDDQLFEPSKKMIVKSLIPRHLNFQIWKYLLESYASEQAARMVAMDNATENGQELIKDLTLDFNKARQAAITKEMLEIVGGAEALATN